ncbi:unnamed protein product [Auanema sp. JU1783]|nr:unnamed protein product [Auanema sp. JU1783]
MEKKEAEKLNPEDFDIPDDFEQITGPNGLARSSAADPNATPVLQGTQPSSPPKNPQPAVPVEQQPSPQHAAVSQRGVSTPTPPKMTADTAGRLKVIIMDANLTKNYGLVRMDPYCKLRIGSNLFETQTSVSGGRNPTWNRTIYSYIPVGVDSVYIQIFDEKAFTDDQCIAWAHIVLPQAVFLGDTIEDYYVLSGQQGEGQEGMVHLLFSFTPVDKLVEGQQPGLVEGLATTSAPNVGHVAPTRPPMTEAELDAAVNELSEMFPNIELEVVRCVLEVHQGAKDAAVTSLLNIGEDS